MRKEKRKLVFWVCLAAGIVAIIDRLGKGLSELSVNRGIGYGLFPQTDWDIPLVIITACVSVLLVFKKLSWWWGLVVIGSANNMIDRIMYRGVGDWLFIGNLAFNLSDVLIVAGLVGYVVDWVFQRRVS